MRLKYAALALRVLFVSPIGDLGGAEQSLIDLIVPLRASPELELSVLLFDDGPLRGCIESLDVPVQVVPMPPAVAALGEFGRRSSARSFLRAGAAGDFAIFLARLGRALRAARPDVVHTNGIKAHWLVSALRRDPVVLHFRDFVKERALTRHALRPLLATGRRVGIAISEAVARDLRAAFPRLAVELVYDGIDTDALCPGPGDGSLLAALAGQPVASTGTLNIGILGTYARWKGQDVFLRAASEVRRALPSRSLRFYVVGGPIYKTAASQFEPRELQQLAGELGIADSVGFIPFQTNVLHIYRSLDVVVHASTRPEPFGRTIAEAMACGRPVIAMREGGAKELFIEGKHALGAEPRSSESLASALVRVLSQPTLRAALSVEARKHAVEHFSRARFPSDLGRVYARATSREP